MLGGGGVFNLLHKKATLFSKIKNFTDLREPNLCIFFHNLWEHLKWPQFYVLEAIKSRFKGPFFWGTPTVPANWTDPTALVCFHIFVPVSRLGWEHTNTHTLGIQTGYCSAMSSINRPKQPFGWGSPCHLLHMNSFRYSCRKLGFVFPFIFLNLSFATDQLLSACCVWTPVIGSTKLTEWLTAWWLKPKTLCICLYAAHSSVYTKEPGCTCLWIMGKRVRASRLLTSCKYGRAGSNCVSKSPRTHLSPRGRRPLWNCG